MPAAGTEHREGRERGEVTLPLGVVLGCTWSASSLLGVWFPPAILGLMGAGAFLVFSFVQLSRTIFTYIEIEDTSTAF